MQRRKYKQFYTFALNSLPVCRPYPILLLLLFSALVLSPGLSAQTAGGIPGYLRIPTATIHSDGTLVIGSGFIPKNYLPEDENNFLAGHDVFTAFGGITFLPFVELDIRVTGMIDRPEGSSFAVDRVPSLRFRLLKENWRDHRWLPSVVAGFQDVVTSAASGDPRLFGASYIVLTKNFHIKPAGLLLEATAGYGSPWFIWENNELIGIFGGVELKHEKLRWLTLLFDYDTETPNAGIRLFLFRHLSITAGYINFNSFTGTVSLQFDLAGK